MFRKLFFWLLGILIPVFVAWLALYVLPNQLIAKFPVASPIINAIFIPIHGFIEGAIRWVVGLIPTNAAEFNTAITTGARTLDTVGEGGRMISSNFVYILIGILSILILAAVIQNRSKGLGGMVESSATWIVENIASVVILMLLVAIILVLQGIDIVNLLSNSISLVAVFGLILLAAVAGPQLGEALKTIMQAVSLILIVAILVMSLTMEPTRAQQLGSNIHPFVGDIAEFMSNLLSGVPDIAKAVGTLVIVLVGSLNIRSRQRKGGRK